MSVHYDMPDVEYHGMRDHLSSTGIRKLMPPSTPAHFKSWRDNPQPHKAAYDLGHVVHAMVLGKGSQFAVLDPAVHGLTTKGQATDSYASTAMWKENVAAVRAEGKVPLELAAHQAAVDMAGAVRDQVPDMFVNGHAEVSVFANDPATGVPLRARFDWLDGEDAYDLKTSASSEPGDFERAATKFGYHVQEAFYRHVAHAAGLHIATFTFVAVEKSDPYPVTTHEWDDWSRAEAVALVRNAIKVYAQCTERDEWPAYHPGPHLMSLPAWMLDDEIAIAK